MHALVRTFQTLHVHEHACVCMHVSMHAKMSECVYTYVMLAREYAVATYAFKRACSRVCAEVCACFCVCTCVHVLMMCFHACA